jgi:hypothetical protein
MLKWRQALEQAIPDRKMVQEKLFVVSGAGEKKVAESE